MRPAVRVAFDDKWRRFNGTLWRIASSGRGSFIGRLRQGRRPGFEQSRAEGCSMVGPGSILQRMDEHVVGTGGSLFEFGGKRPFRETAQWVSGVGSAGGGVAIAAVGTASGSYLSMPLSFAVAVLGAIVLFLYAVTSNKTRKASASAHTGRLWSKSIRKGNANESIASELALLADLYSRGARTPEEFIAAKRRILNN